MLLGVEDVLDCTAEDLEGHEQLLIGAGRAVAVLFRLEDQQGGADVGRVAEGRLSPPYTRALLSVLPVADPEARYRKAQILSGETPDPSQMPIGCRFHPRCPVAIDRCRTVDPSLVRVGPDHEAACILVEEVPLSVPTGPSGGDDN